MKIYTRTGDDGQTALFGGPRVRKDMVRVEAYGTLDELNAVLGLVRTEPLADEIDRLLARVQNELFEVGAEIASLDPIAKGTRSIGQAHIQAIENEIDRYESALAPLEHFILPGGTRGAALLHIARTVCRRAERRLVALVHDDPEKVSLALVAYLNRLGDLLFVLARAVNAQAGRPDVIWLGSARTRPH
jgi:cob(I)alamin adenosyltransferase